MQVTCAGIASRRYAGCPRTFGCAFPSVRRRTHKWPLRCSGRAGFAGWNFVSQRKWLPVLFRAPGAVRVSFGRAKDSVLHVADLRAEALAQRLRRRTRTRPSKPVPSKTIVAGSGVVVVERTPSANPVMGPQFVPDAVQKWTA